MSKYNKDDTITFIEKAKKTHGTMYGYANTIYTGSKQKVVITCRKHGDFLQRASKHIAGRGCKECGKVNSSATQGWSDSDWETMGNSSSRFYGFRLYIIKCYNKDEVFYKIGKTFNKLSVRFSKDKMPYEWIVVKETEGSAKAISKEERRLIKENKNNKYIPKVPFGGMHECFTMVG